MNRRRFLAGISLLAAGGGAGASIGFAAGPAVTAEGPTARTATPAGPGTYLTTVTFRTAPADQGSSRSRSMTARRASGRRRC